MRHVSKITRICAVLLIVVYFEKYKYTTPCVDEILMLFFDMEYSVQGYL